MASYLKDAIIEDGVNDKRVFTLIEKANKAIKGSGFSLSFSRYSSDTAGFNIKINQQWEHDKIFSVHFNNTHVVIM